MVKDFLGKLNPAREPVVYLFLALVVYQIVFKGESIPEAWIQYVVEFIAAIGARQIVTPKINETK